MATGVAAVAVLGPGINRAEAYIDPGTGGAFLSSLGMVLGVMTACLAVAFAQVRRCGGWLLTKVATRRRAEANCANDNSGEQPPV